MHNLLQDVRGALRVARKDARTSSLIIIILALGISATTTIYSVVQGVLLRPMSYSHPDELVSILQVDGSARNTSLRSGMTVPFTEFVAWRAGSHAFEDMAAYTGGQPILTGLGDPARVNVFSITSNLFALLGAHPLLGRVFTPDEDRDGSAPVVVLSYATWASRYGSDPRVLGQTVILDNTPYQIVGVMPHKFRFPVLPVGFPSMDAAMWSSMGSHLAESKGASQRWAYWIIGRLKPGMTIAGAQAQLDAISRGLWETEPRLHDWVADILPLRDSVVGAVRTRLLFMLGAVVLVLLIACANVANLLLARAVERQHEMAIRAAVGASRPRLIRQVLTESLVFAVAGGTLGVIMAIYGVRLLVPLVGGELPRMNGIGINTHVLAVMVAVAGLTGSFFGLAPALTATSRLSASALKEGGAGSGMGTSATVVNSALVVVQVALTMTLLANAGLLAQSFVRLVMVDPGFDPAHVLAAQVTLPTARYGSASRIDAFAEAVIARAGALPAVASVAVSTGMPLAPTDFGQISVVGARSRPEAPMVHFTAVTPAYFRTLGIPLRRGRFLEARSAAAPHEALINEALQRIFFGTQNPLGQRIIFSTDTGFVVGVVGDTRELSLDAPAPPHIYMPLAAERPSGNIPAFYLKVLVKSRRDPALLAGPVRSVLGDVDRVLPVDVLTMQDMISDSVAKQRLYAAVVVAFAVLALVIAAIGIYAIARHTAARRMRELGIRIALGAGRRDLAWLVIGRSVRLVALGVTLGAVGALATTRLLSSVLFEVAPTDPYVFILVTVGLGGVALIASWWPALQAMHTDPMIALRNE